MAAIQSITPYGNKGSKKEQVTQMFNRIAFRYDFLNHFLSLGIDTLWRKQAIAELPTQRPIYVLDVATGTGDLALDALRNKDIHIIGIDISPGMLGKADEKILKRKVADRFRVEIGDSENLRFEQGTFEAVMVAFGVRNFENLVKGLEEIYRVLKPGGKLIILEFSKPESSPFKELYNFYFEHILPFLGKQFSKDAQAYEYLQKSVKNFPDGTQFTDILKKLGYNHTNYKPLSLGICTLYTAIKTND